MSTIIDRRKNTRGKSSSNRRRFLKRVEKQIKDAIPDIVDDEDIDLSDNKKKVKIPTEGIKEPSFIYKKDVEELIVTGNNRFVKGDLIPKKKTGKGRPGKGDPGDSDDGSEDSFTVTISKDEFIKYFFQDLELPDAIKKKLNKDDDYDWAKAGHVKEGTPNKIDIERSFKNSIGRKIGIGAVYDEEIKKLKKKKKLADTQKEKDKIQEKIEELETLRNAIPFLDDFDLRYDNYVKKPTPSISCKMIMIMDVSASMGRKKKDIAKRFFMLMYMFLTKAYNNIDMIFIRHTSEAKEVDEEEFFNSRETGGTKVKPALELANNIIDGRFDLSQDNVYIAQVGDGDVFVDDATASAELIKTNLLDKLQYMCYLEVVSKYYWANQNKALYDYYTDIQSDKFNQERVKNVTEIWPVFKKLFSKDNG